MENLRVKTFSSFSMVLMRCRGAAGWGKFSRRFAKGENLRLNSRSFRRRCKLERQVRQGIRELLTEK